MSNLLHNMSEVHMAQYARCFEEIDLEDLSSHPANDDFDFQQSLHFDDRPFGLDSFLFFFLWCGYSL